MSTTQPTYWPPEGQPEFVSHDDERTWTPLCDCGRETYYRFTPWGSWHCDNLDAHGSLGMRLMLDPEDWPDYNDESED